MEDGATAEVGTLGNEGMIGSAVFLGDRDELKLTHEFLAIMLGVRRPTVTLIAGTLEKGGLIANGQRGTINITNRAGLEAACCECYATVRTHFARLLPEIPTPMG